MPVILRDQRQPGVRRELTKLTQNAITGKAAADDHDMRGSRHLSRSGQRKMAKLDMPSVDWSTMISRLASL